MSNLSVTSSCADLSITPRCTVDAVIGHSPVAAAVLNGFGVDTCCGGRGSLAEAAVHARVDVEILIAALDAAERDAENRPALALPVAPSCSCGCR